MGEHRAKLVVVAVMALIVGVPFLLRPAPAVPDAAPEGASEGASGGGGRGVLIILTPHNEQIRYEFARAFNAHRAAAGLPAVTFDWRASGGTSDLRKNVLSQFAAVGDRGAEAAGIGVDLFWGGGDYEHNQLARGPVIHLTPRDEDGAGHRYALDRTLVRDATLTLQWTLDGRGEAGDARPIVAVRVSEPEARVELAPAVGAPAVGHAGRALVAATVRVAADAPHASVVEVKVTNSGDNPVTLGGIAFSAETREAFDSASASATLSFPVTVPAHVPDDLLAAAFPRATIGGESLYHRDLYWVGVALSSFGIVYNNDLLAMLDAPTPDTWRDLAAPQLRGWVALADPAHSGSIAQTYNVILRRLGWREGWSLLREVFANARYFTSSASKVPVDVSSGEAAAGMCIDFYGRFQAGAVSRFDASDRGKPRVGYVDPQYLTAVTADPISVMRGAPHAELAHEFVRFLLTPEAQRLWQRRIGTPDGPTQFELRRLPIRADLYTTREAEYWTDPEADPWSYTRPLPEGTPNYYALVGPLAHAMAIDIHDDLAAAWRAILETPPDHPHMAEMLHVFDQMPPELVVPWPDDRLRAQWQLALEDESHPRHAEAAATLAAFSDNLSAIVRDPDLLLRKRLEWTLFFRGNYRRVVALARE